MIILVWKFEIAASHRAAFEAAYGPKGDWAQLCSQAPGFISVELLKDGAGNYLTLDRWRTRADFDAFKHNFAAQYAALDHACETLTTSETFVGQFEN